jgi:hypothetical protein
VTYFALASKHQGLEPGIYLKHRFAYGSAVRPVFIFVPSVLYRPRLPFYAVGESTIRTRLPVYFDAEWMKVVTTARLRR